MRRATVADREGLLVAVLEREFVFLLGGELTDRGWLCVEYSRRYDTYEAGLEKASLVTGLALAVGVGE